MKNESFFVRVLLPIIATIVFAVITALLWSIKRDEFFFVVTISVCSLILFGKIELINESRINYNFDIEKEVKRNRGTNVVIALFPLIGFLGCFITTSFHEETLRFLKFTFLNLLFALMVNYTLLLIRFILSKAFNRLLSLRRLSRIKTKRRKNSSVSRIETMRLLFDFSLFCSKFYLVNIVKN